MSGMPPRPTASSAKEVLVRFGSLLVLAVVSTTLPLGISDPDLRGLVPFFLGLIYLHIAPAIWMHRAELFCPPVFHGIQGAVAITATLASFIASGRVDVDLVKGLDPYEQLLLAEKTIWLYVLSLVGYYAGYYALARRPFPRFTRRFRFRGWDRRKLLWITIGCALVFIASYAFFQARLGLPLFNFRVLGKGKAVWREEATLSWMIRGVQLVFVPIFFYLALAAWQKQKRRTLVMMGILVFTALLVLRLGQRGIPYFACLTALPILHYQWKRIPIWAFVVVLLLATGVSNILYEWRTGYAAAEAANANIAEATEALATHEEERKRFAGTALILHHFPHTHDYLLGRSWLAVLVMPIPRWVWPAKHEHFQWRTNLIIRNLGGGPRPPTLPAILYANFSWLGVAIGMMLWGAFHRRLYASLQANPADPAMVLMYAVVLFHFAPTMLGLSSALQYVVPAWAMLLVLDRRVAQQAHRVGMITAPGGDRRPASG